MNGRCAADSLPRIRSTPAIMIYAAIQGAISLHLTSLRATVSEVHHLAVVGDHATADRRQNDHAAIAMMRATSSKVAVAASSTFSPEKRTRSDT